LVPGDAYSPQSVVVDARSGMAYVLSGRSDGDAAVISVVDLARREVVRRFDAPDIRRNAGGRLLIAPDGRTLYLVDQDRNALTAFDPQSGRAGASLGDVREAALSPDGTTIYVSGDKRLAAYRADGLDPLWSIAAERVRGLVVGADGVRLAGYRFGPQATLMTFDAATGQILRSLEIKDAEPEIAAGPDGGWFVRASLSTPRLLRYSPDLKVEAEVEVAYGDGMIYDAAQGRVLVSAYRSEADPQHSLRPVLLALDERDLATLRAADWPLNPASVYSQGPDVLVPYGSDGLVALNRYGLPHLNFVDPATLQSTGRAVLGVSVTGMALDDAAGVIYLSDSEDRVHMIDLATHAERGQWPGAAPLALDTANHRLYVNRPEGVTALDATTGDLQARFAQRGVPAADPQRDLVYVARSGVYVFDRAGRPLDPLANTFPTPQGLAPNPYAFTVRVNPANGYVFATMNNGVPGSNNRSYLQVFPPGADTFVLPSGNARSVDDLVFDSMSGEAYASYYPTFNSEAIQRLSPDGRELARLAGRHGKLAFDHQAGLLYAIADGTLARLEPDALGLLGIDAAPDGIEEVVLWGAGRRLYLRRSESSRVVSLAVDALQPLDTRPHPVTALPQETFSSLAVVNGQGGAWVYGAMGTRLLRSRDGQRWEQLPVGSGSVIGQLTALDGGVLFWDGIGGRVADGVWRSLDGGGTWELLARGLADLRSSRKVAAVGPDEAYFVSRTAGVYGWDAATRRWLRVFAPSSDTEPAPSLWLAPDGTLFLSAGRYMRSDDRGQTWRDAPPPSDRGAILGFDADFARSRTMFSYGCAGQTCRVHRSRDAGVSWQPIGDGLSLAAYGVDLVLGQHAAAFYLYAGGYRDQSLYRSTDGGDTWGSAPAEVVTGTNTFAVAPDGGLWLGVKAGVRRVDPAAIAWTASRAVVAPAVKQAATPTRTPAPLVQPTPQRPTSFPTPFPCAKLLSEPAQSTARSYPALGCPTGDEREVQMAQQTFERGEMLWREDERAVYVLQAGDGWQRYADMWQEGLPESDPAIAAPAGLQQPVRGFGKVWREQLGGPAAAVGWAKDREQGIKGHVQTWEGGATIRLGGRQIVLLSDGEWRWPGRASAEPYGAPRRPMPARPRRPGILPLGEHRWRNGCCSVCFCW
jgi:DNA-binding beta-propeller fold protein YncE/photosystem II stability/assembly factor-like uncharacterized protein